MKYTKNHFFGVLILVFSIYLIGSGTGFFATTGVLGDAIFLPVFSHAYCTNVGDILYPNNDGEYITKSNSILYDTRGLENGFFKEFGRVSNSNKHTLQYRVLKGTGGVHIWKFPLTVTTEQLKTTPWGNLGVVADTFSTGVYSTTTGWINTYTYDTRTEKVVIAFKDVPLGGDIDGDEVKYRISTAVYGLQVERSNNFLTILPNNCDLDYLGTHQNAGDVANTAWKEAYASGIILPGNVLDYGQNVNWISGHNLGESAYVIDSGTKYVLNIGEYAPIKTAENGVKYVDTLNIIKDSSIICIPSTTCIDGRKLVTVEDGGAEGQACSLINQPPRYVLQTGNNVCETSCVSGVVKYSNCITIERCDTNEIRNEKYECVKLGDSNIIATPPTPEWVYWLVGGILLMFLILVGLLIATTPTGKKIRGR